MLIQDTAAFIEEIDVTGDGKRIDQHRSRITQAEVELLEARSEVQMAAGALEAMERLRTQQHESSTPNRKRLSRRSGELRSLERDMRSVAAHLRAKQREVVAKQRRVQELTQKADEHNARRQRAALFRLHSAGHYVQCQEGQFARLSAAQLESPVLVSRNDGRRWWWFLDRFWWDDERRTAQEVKSAVLALDLENRRTATVHEKERAAVLAEPNVPDLALGVPDGVQSVVWHRDKGRCVDCRASQRLVFDRIIPIALGGSNSASNVELRCESCLAQRARNRLRARVSRARLDAHADEERAIPDPIRDAVWARDGGRCVDCGSDRRLALDHIVSVSKGGTTIAENLELRCERCTSRRSTAGSSIDWDDTTESTSAPTSGISGGAGRPGGRA